MVGSVECSPLCAAFLACGAYYVLWLHSCINV